MHILENILFMCPDCEKDSGQGKFIRVTYTNSGGWSPVWEVRICEHLRINDVLMHLGLDESKNVK